MERENFLDSKPETISFIAFANEVILRFRKEQKPMLQMEHFGEETRFIYHEIARIDKQPVENSVKFLNLLVLMRGFVNYLKGSKFHKNQSETLAPDLIKIIDKYAFSLGVDNKFDLELKADFLRAFDITFDDTVLQNEEQQKSNPTEAKHRWNSQKEKKFQSVSVGTGHQKVNYATKRIEDFKRAFNHAKTSNLLGIRVMTEATVQDVINAMGQTGSDTYWFTAKEVQEMGTPFSTVVYRAVKAVLDVFLQSNKEQLRAISHALTPKLYKARVQLRDIMADADKSVDLKRAMLAALGETGHNLSINSKFSDFEAHLITLAPDKLDAVHADLRAQSQDPNNMRFSPEMVRQQKFEAIREALPTHAKSVYETLAIDNPGFTPEAFIHLVRGLKSAKNDKARFKDMVPYMRAEIRTVIDQGVDKKTRKSKELPDQGKVATYKTKCGQVDAAVKALIEINPDALETALSQYDDQYARRRQLAVAENYIQHVVPGLSTLEGLRKFDFSDAVTVQGQRALREAADTLAQNAETQGEALMLSGFLKLPAGFQIEQLAHHALGLCDLEAEYKQHESPYILSLRQVMREVRKYEYVKDAIKPEQFKIEEVKLEEVKEAEVSAAPEAVQVPKVAPKPSTVSPKMSPESMRRSADQVGTPAAKHTSPAEGGMFSTLAPKQSKSFDVFDTGPKPKAAPAKDVEEDIFGSFSKPI